MNYYTAKTILDMQERRLRKLNGVRFPFNGYEYRLKYCPGFAPTVRIDRRPLGKRNFKWFDTIGVYDCVETEDAMRRVKEVILCNG